MTPKEEIKAKKSTLSNTMLTVRIRHMWHASKSESELPSKESKRKYSPWHVYFLLFIKEKWILMTKKSIYKRMLLLNHAVNNSKKSVPGFPLPSYAIPI